MNYKNIYDNIINRAKQREVVIGNYYENHHIIPKCMGGNDNSENKVKLTAKEHFICHYLLHRDNIFNSKLAFAFWNMCQQSSDQHRVVPSSRMYVYGKQQYIKHIKKINTGRKHIYNESLKKAKCVKLCDLQEYLNDGWVLKCISKGTTNHTAVYNESLNEYKTIHIDKLTEYINNGWIKKGKPTVVDKKIITDLNTGKCEWIDKRDIGEYKNNKNYKIGLIKNSTIGKTSMYKDGVYKMIPNDLVTEYTDNGWIKKGKPRNKNRNASNKNKIIINNNEVNKYIQNIDLQKYVNDGWSVGRINTQSPIKGKKRITKDGVIKYINKLDLQKYLNDGWQIGRK